jgi:hypothetical protein
MRFMMLVLPRNYQSVAPDATPDPRIVERMTRYNEELQKAGVLLALDGLFPPSAGTRLHFNGGKVKVIDGPFPESKEAVGGYWIIQTRSKAEALEWARRAPMPDGEMIELRQIQEMSDFPPDVQEAAGYKPAS